MADSNITRKALAAALKAQMQEEPFSGVSIGEICDRCDMNRKSFYYHFKDKYDLLNWIYDMEFLEVSETGVSGWAFWGKLLERIRENRGFYRRAMEVKGQNSFHEHFEELMCPVVRERLEALLPGRMVTDFQVRFYAGATTEALELWLQEREPWTWEEMLKQIMSCFPGQME